MGSILATGKTFFSGLPLFSSPVKKEESKPLIAKADVTYSGLSLFLASSKEQTKNWCKLGNYGSFWANRVLSRPSSVLSGFGKDMGHFKNCLSVFDLFKKSPEVAGQLASVCMAPSIAGAGSLVTKSSELFNSCADVAGAVNTYIPISCIRTISSINIGATLIFAASKVKETVPKLINAKTNELRLHYVMKLVADLAYVTFAMISLTALSMGTTASLPALMGCLTAGTVLGLTSFFYERVYDPEKKNENVDFGALKPRLQLA